MNERRDASPSPRARRGASRALLHCAVVLAVLGGGDGVPFDGSPSPLLAQDYARPVDVAPQPEDIGEGYAVPDVQRPTAKSEWEHRLDVALYVVGLCVVAWIALRQRSRVLLFWVTVACLLWFGFWREGCVCPIGATQNVAVALVDPSYSVPILVVIIFFLPLAFALLFGRVFCGGVCPLGGIQDVVLVKPIQVPRTLDRCLGAFKYIYLGLAIWLAVQPVEARDFIICRFDPFVGLFRRTGSAEMLLFGGALLVGGMFVGRIYCRWLCPYGALLAIFSRFAWKSVSISPGRELDCGLCAKACPYGAIETMRARKTACLACARCFSACPIERLRRGDAPACTRAARAGPESHEPRSERSRSEHDAPALV